MSDDCDTGLSLMLDANCINARGNDEAINQLEQWADRGCIDIMMCRTSREESYADGNQQRFQKAQVYLYSETRAETDEERQQLTAIAQMLFPNGPVNQNQRNDIDIVFNALKYAGILVTRDGASRTQPGGILGARAQLLHHGLRVMNPEDAVAHVRGRIALARQ